MECSGPTPSVPTLMQHWLLLANVDVPGRSKQRALGARSSSQREDAQLWTCRDKPIQIRLGGSCLSYCSR